MRPEEITRFSPLWIGCYELYGKPCSDAAVALAFKILSRFELEDISRALESHALDPDGGRFAPKPADIAKYITGDPESKPLQAWTQVEEAIRRAGPYRTIVFDDPLAMAVVADMGGWVQLCKIEDKELPFKRNEFTTRYRGFMLSPPRTWPARLLGLAGESEPPTLIGNPEVAQRVLASGSLQPRLAMRSVADLITGIGCTLPAPEKTQ